MTEEMIHGLTTYKGYTPSSDSPAAQPEIANINLEHLRRQYGNGFGTSGYEIYKAAPNTGEENTLRLTTWFSACKKDECDPTKLIDEGITILTESFADYNSLKHLFGQYDATWAIKLGEILIGQKKLVLKAGLEWGAWAADKLPSMGKRTREKFMNLAKRKDCHRYSLLGVERLDMICSATKESEEGSDRIGAFMTEYKIMFDPTKEFDLQEFKLQVDTALNLSRLIKNKLPADQKSVRDLTVAGKEVNNSVINKMKDIQGCGGDAALYLKNLTLTAGSDTEDDKTTFGNFNKTSTQLIRTIDYLIKDKEDEIVQIHQDTLVKLLKKLDTLRRLTLTSLKSDQAT